MPNAQRAGSSQNRSGTATSPIQFAPPARPHILHPPPHNLVRPLDSFVGRQRELAEITRLLTSSTAGASTSTPDSAPGDAASPPCRLLTLTGLGGAGKTRLARQAAGMILDHAAERFVDGVWWVNLANLADPAFVAPTVGAALSIHERVGQPFLVTLVETLHDRALLLILDNCEHLIEACAEVAWRVLETCPRVRILATSREALGVPGETVWPVPPLSDAVRLFIDRATAALPGFNLTEHNTSVVTEICSRLDGLPLAIELAAARVTVLPVTDIASRLGNALRLLTGGRRVAHQRHRTLEATLDWSYDLLSDAERVLFRRLAVFAGGFTLAAAEAVCAEDVLDLLGRLVDKSLVSSRRPNEPARHTLLEVVRQYALDRLHEAGEWQQARARHAEYYVNLAEQNFAHKLPADLPEAMQRAAEDIDNLRVALHWVIETRDATLALRLTGALWRFWQLRGYLSEGRHWLALALDQTNMAGAAPQHRAPVLVGAARLAHLQTDYTPAAWYATEALTLYQTLGSPSGIAAALAELANGADAQGDHARAVELHTQALALRREIGDQAGIAATLSYLGWNALYQRDFARAETLFEEYRQLATALQNSYSLGIAQTMLGVAVLFQGDPRRAAQWFAQGLTTSHPLGDQVVVSIGLLGAAGVASAEGRAEQAARWLGAASRLRAALGVKNPPAAEALYQHIVKTTRSQLDETRFQLAWDEGHALSLDQAVAEASRETFPAEPAVSAPLPALRFQALGVARVYRDQRLLTAGDWTYPKARELLFYLLTYGPKTRDEIGVAMWPEASSTQLRRRLHDCLYHLRQALGRRDAIILDDHGYRINPSLNYDYDVTRFEQSLKEVSSPPSLSALEQSLDLYQGDFLADIDADWPMARRERLRQAHQTAMLTFAHGLAEVGETSRAITIYRQIIAHDPYLEMAHRALMTALARQGEPGQAVRHYQGLVELLRTDLDTPPSPETQALYESLKRG